MTTKKPRTARRGDALSKERIVRAAVETLDEGGEDALTFRVLANRLSTGPGAIYHHVAGKDELLRAATDEVIAHVTTGAVTGDEPGEAIRAIMLGVFDAIHARPWVGAQLSREPWQTAMLQIFESAGGQLAALGVPEHAQFDAASALVNYVLGIAGQSAAGARALPRETDQSAFLETIAAQWTTQHDAAKYPFVHQVVAQLAEHDDRKQFLAGIDLILAGISTIR
ncbi:TetR/AcrR family transcriptional regulator [Streptosporangium roseum]|uniref:Transcriptional regulator, TetR family n=1 Tax=Streptosporangium roseum (strain ATCC 12428 / DSM 43021 / JCM 3005 / KCTC 9067 / NCIMB 10171 / NRRL 2505 / NI 9100) TaxID=479432 RepID=D2B095_STRRD|nr:TetR/AcrR family transcriptional regulator [Streptosporangium roseum]ACZ89101.1 putative transcriptional regulator, TetR family [Streptosporangium roseum DSM 43021]